MDAVFNRRLFAHALAGSSGSMVAMTLLYPLDRVRTIKQLGQSKQLGQLRLLQDLFRTQGLAGFYKGLGPMLAALGVGNFVYFYVYTGLRGLVRRLRRAKYNNGQVSTYANLIIATIAGVVNVFTTTPLWVVYARRAAPATPNGSEVAVAKPRGGIPAALLAIAREEGLRILWSGITPSLILVCNPTVQFVAYERLKQALLTLKYGFSSAASEDAEGLPMLSSAEYLLLGAFAKMIATFLTYPMQVVQTRLRVAQAQHKKLAVEGSSKFPASTTVACMKTIFREEGLLGLYAGMDAKLLQTCLTSAFMFTCYEHMSRAIIQVIGGPKRNARGNYQQQGSWS
eukprot:TRINITY_DN65453_c0_g1_i1.p1 TRINITY_DN65453_c0_g1~~TRINITY_DN65453_c0_g1_i1.p1  ORF type:complete len:341 (-),score=53.05 TRINITY_DN65453_c0_g1_i1:36-1058(-)